MKNSELTRKRPWSNPGPFLFVVLWCVAAQAAPPDVLNSAGKGPVVTVVDGDTVRVKDHDADIRLIGKKLIVSVLI